MNIGTQQSLGTSLCFDDVLLEPLLSTITSRKTISLDINIGTNGRELILKTPLISSPMDTVTEKDMAIKLALNGGIGIIHRYMTIEDQVSQVKQVKRYLQYIITNPYTISSNSKYNDIIDASNKYNVSSFCIVDENYKLVGLITRRDLEYIRFCVEANPDIHLVNISNFMTKSIMKIICNDDNHTFENLDYILSNAKMTMLLSKVEKLPITDANGVLIGLITLKNIRHYENNKSNACVNKNGALCVGAAIGIVDDYMDRLDQLVNVGVDLICIDVANGFNTNVINTTQQIRAKYPHLVLMAGNVCNWQGFAALNETDVDCIRVGVGNGSICTTRLETGIGKGQFSAVNECFDYLFSKSQQFKANIICDGGSLGKTGNKVKAIASGACAIMLGRTLASTEESPGSIIYRNGKRFKYIRGMASAMANIGKQEKLSHIDNNSKNNSNVNTVNIVNTVNTKIHAEGVDGEQELSGSVVDVIEQINGGLKSGFSYLGCNNISEIHVKRQNGDIKFNIVSSIGMSETGIRVKTY
jgi:IMP dehydrogenase